MIDRSAVLADWVPVIRGMVDNGVYVHAYFNNHFAGYAPESLEMFRRLWQEGGAMKLGLLLTAHVLMIALACSGPSGSSRPVACRSPY